MSNDRRPDLTPDRVRDMAATAGLSLDKSRAEALTPWVDQVFAMMDGLDAIPLGETPPAFAFKCRRTDV